MVPTFYKKRFLIFQITSLQYSRSATIAAEIQLIRTYNSTKECKKKKVDKLFLQKFSVSVYLRVKRDNYNKYGHGGKENEVVQCSAWLNLAYRKTWETPVLAHAKLFTFLEAEKGHTFSCAPSFIIILPHTRQDFFLRNTLIKGKGEVRQSLQCLNQFPDPCSSNLTLNKSSTYSCSLEL